MLNVIFTINDIRAGLTEEQTAYFNSSFNFVAELPECRKVDNKITYQGNVGSIDEIDGIIQMLTALGGDPVIIGIWKNDGLQYGYKQIISGYNTVDITCTKKELVSEGYIDGDEIIEPVYKDVEYIEKEEEPIYKIVRDTDEDGNEISIPYPFNQTEYINYLADIVTYDEEGNELSRNRPIVATQVNKFGGMKDRDLKIY